MSELAKINPLVINYGAGVNSTALICEAYNRGITPDHIVFADTGSERPETYEFLDLFDSWLAKHSFPLVTRVRWIRVRAPHRGKFVPLHEWCESEKTVPSRAYGFSGCTSKWKQQPVDRHLRDDGTLKMWHNLGRKVERWIGYDADEPQRAERMLDKSPDAHLWIWRAPLVEWDMGRDECLATLKAAGLPSPGKSSCWMCPSMRKPEIVQLGRDHPKLLKRALRMEKQAIEAGNLGTNLRNGLGGRLNWGEYIEAMAKANEGTRKLDRENPVPLPDEYPDPPEMSCGCYDGGDDD